ncbi:MAG: Demethylmenaquinone methyltransferase [Verrucomicrobia bacterium ADurb.Bin474]|nr:MAG: Demethylmenaquinone methyltransferase [Verrucomicrobia bacterium ADurb.Bin474]
MKMNNRRNLLIYRMWAPIYDRVAGRFMCPGRSRAMAVLNLQPGDRVLLVGVGTGADLPLLPPGVSAVGVDLSIHMLDKARRKLPIVDREIHLVQGDAQELLVEEGAFDAVIFNLILSVIPDGKTCLRENLRALKPGGRAVVFDKFLPDNRSLTIWRRLLNFGTALFGTDITRRFSDLVSDESGIEILLDEPSILRGAYRVKLIAKKTDCHSL